MAAYQGAFSSILGGVSQQVYTERLPSQVSEQINMTSDTVRGLRKRPGTRKSIDVSGVAEQWSLGNEGHLRQFDANLGWGVTSFVVNTITGALTALVEDSTMQYVGKSNYLITDNPADIVFTTVGSSLYIGNCSVLPVAIQNETRPSPDLGGYFFVLAGGYKRTYSLTITTNLGSFTASYTTPSADSGSDASDYTTAEYICGQLNTQLQAQVGGATGLTGVYTTNGYIYMTVSSAAGSLNVSTPTGKTYAVASNTHTVSTTDDLPAMLASAAEGFIMTVGDNSFAQYFKWDNANTRWIECGAYNSPTGIDADTMPILVQSTSTDNQHAIIATTWGGREAGDELNNETPAFLDASGVGMTGLASFQGRLIIFSGPYISMSSNVKQYSQYFYRTTVTQVLDGDRIEFTSTSFSGASFRHGVPFNSDLILASDTYQGVIPGRNQVLTPNNATAVLTSTYQMDTRIAPKAGGRSLYYAYPRSSSSFAIKEMLPSGYTDLQYTSQDVTDHLPTYLEGSPRFITSSTTNNIVVLGGSTDTDTLYINEYLWSGDNKVISAWHKWTLDGTIHAAWFIRENLLILIERDATMQLLTLSMRDSPDPTDPSRFLPATDFNLSMSVTNAGTDAPYIQFPSAGVGYQLWSAINAVGLSNIAVVVGDGKYIGAEVGVLSLSPGTRRLYLQPDYGRPTMLVGIRFTSMFSPTPPTVRNQDGSYRAVDKLIIQSYILTLRYSGPFIINAKDDGGVVYDAVESSAIDYNSADLSLDAATLDKRYNLPIRMGLIAETSETVFTSNAASDFNLQSLGYSIKFNNRLRRI